ncbi:hypothetical protein BCEN4_180078 [Burkholderia cenocepacia]|nr:hypothetical protein BCEN4_180078 [Burkholderia cenocepacia]
MRCCTAPETSSEIKKLAPRADRSWGAFLSNGKLTGHDLSLPAHSTRLQFPGPFADPPVPGRCESQAGECSFSPQAIPSRGIARRRMRRPRGQSDCHGENDAESA